MRTYYDISTLTDDVHAKAVKYIESCSGKEIRDDVWETPVKLQKLTQFIVDEDKALEFPNI